MAGASAKPQRGTTVRAPVAVTASRVFATVKTLNGALASERRDSTPGTRRVREKTSKGPAKSRTSTSSKIRMPVLIRSMGSPLGPVPGEFTIYQRPGGRSGYPCPHGYGIPSRPLRGHRRPPGRAHRPGGGGAVDRRRGAAGARPVRLAGPPGRDGGAPAPPPPGGGGRAGAGGAPGRFPLRRGRPAGQCRGLLRSPQQLPQRGAGPRAGHPHHPGAGLHGGGPAGGRAAGGSGLSRPLPAAALGGAAAPPRSLRSRPPADRGGLPPDAGATEPRLAALRLPPAAAVEPAADPGAHAQPPAGHLPQSERAA